jgi:KUP system potassium uptake protein
MYVSYNARKITNRYLTFLNFKEFLPLLNGLSKDETVPKYSSHLIYLTKANNPHHIEKRIMNSILGNNPKRADLYWFVHIDRVDEPYAMEYGVEEIMLDKVIRVDFRLGFRVQPRIGLMLKKVVEEMIQNKELDVIGRNPSMKLEQLHNFRFVILEKFLSYDNEFSVRDGFILNSYFTINRLALSDRAAYGLDTSETVTEKVPLVVTPISNVHLKRVFYKIDPE